jgi:dipeptidyl aminopeptidase/acylaminoacyl peptidase
MSRRDPSVLARVGFSFALISSVASVAAARSNWVDALFAHPAIQQVEVNPSGTRIAAHAFYDDTHGLLVQTVATGKTETVLRSTALTRYWWEDDDTLIVRFDGGSYSIIDLKRRDPTRDPNEAFEEQPVRMRGQLVNPLPFVPDRVLWAESTPKESSAYRIPIASLLKPRRQDEDQYRVARVAGEALTWISDRDGVPRAVLTYGSDSRRDRELHLLYRPSAEVAWSAVGSWSYGEKIPGPVGIAANGHDLLVVSAEGRNTAALREYLVDEKKLGAVVYANPSFDIVDVVFGYEGSELIAVVYEEEGVRRYHYLDSVDAAQQEPLDRLFPSRVVHLASRTRDRRFLTVLVDDSRDPGHFYFVDTLASKSIDVGAVMRRIDPALMAPVTAMQVTAKDGQPIEAFFALPVKFSGASPPLVVMPHGGPIGVRDTREFDPVLQSLTTSGYAVLQVNYRGSGGKGIDFLEAGQRALGRQIEDDIEAALDHVITAKRVDPERICIFGWSYGGYSALISITRRPQRYRCAVAGAAPTDLLLWYESSDFSIFEEGKQEYVRIVGDPDRDRDHLIEISPAYHALEMDVPILLIHGDRDTRVDVENSYRMKAMLEAYGRPPEWMLLRDVGHSPPQRQFMRVMERVLEFLDAHLAPVKRE